MIHWHEELPFDDPDPITNEIFTEDAVFFDIETTGFSPQRTRLYLIGCMTRRGPLLLLDQFFAEEKEDEPALLSSFRALLAPCHTLLTFNGSGFDIPYLQSKYRAYGMPDPFDGPVSLDLYKQARLCKKLLPLADLKQKTIEGFLGIAREDTFSGGELIDVYRSFLADPDPKALALLRRHNYEDVLDMPKLLPLLSYRRLLDGHASLLSLEADESAAPDGSRTRALLFSLRLDFPVPKPVSLRDECCYLTADGELLRLRVPLLDEELFFYFDRPEEYCYLPKEDIAVPKELASGVDKAYRRQATPATCYTKKHALFLPQYRELFSPAFCQKRRRTGAVKSPSYFELTEEFTGSPKLQLRYVQHLLSHMA